MNIKEFTEIMELSLIIRYPDTQNRWMAKLENVDEMDDGFLSSYCGYGKNSYEAILDYIEKIRGKKMVYLARDEKYRKEFKVPQSLEVGVLYP